MQARLGVDIAVLALLAFFATDTLAQSLTGALAGTVKDPQSGVLPAVPIRLASDALMSGEVQTISNDKGQWRFAVLPPGAYVISIDMTPRFAGHRRRASESAPVKHGTSR